MVPSEGVEPPRPKARVSKTRVSASSIQLGMFGGQEIQVLLGPFWSERRDSNPGRNAWKARSCQLHHIRFNQHTPLRELLLVDARFARAPSRGGHYQQS